MEQVTPGASDAVRDVVAAAALGVGDGDAGGRLLGSGHEVRRVIIAAWLAAGARASATLCAALPGACDGSFAGGAIVVDGNATIGGTIPTELGQLHGLQEVRLVRCSLSGTVPSEVGRLTALRRRA